MPATYIECPNCGWEGKIEDDQIGRRIKCPKCDTSFLAEVGGSYDLADAPPRPPARTPLPNRPRPEQSAGSEASEPSDEKDSTDKEEWKSWLQEWPQE